MSASLPIFGSLLGLSGVSSAISGLFGLGSSAMNQKSQRDANKANLEIAQMNNQWSEKMMEKQNAMNIDQWNREKNFALEQRDYDSATQQASRLRAAGLNPNLVMSGGNAGSAASTPSGSSVGLPSPSSATMQPVDFSGVARAVESAFNIGMALRKNQAEVHNLESQSAYNNAKAKFEAAEAFERTRNLKVKNLFAYDLEKLNVDNAYYTSEQIQAKTRFDNAMTSFTTSQKLLNDKELEAFDERNRLTLAIMSAEEGLKVAQKQLSLDQAAKAVEEKLLAIAQTTGVRLSNKQFKEMSWSLVKKAEEEAKRASQPQTLFQLGNDIGETFGNFADDYIVKPSKKRLEKTKKGFKSTMYRSFGIKL